MRNARVSLDSAEVSGATAPGSAAVRSGTIVRFPLKVTVIQLPFTEAAVGPVTSLATIWSVNATAAA